MHSILTLGSKVDFSRKDGSIDLGWNSVFSWSSNKPPLVYIVHVGSDIGSANIITGMSLWKTCLSQIIV